MISSTARKTGRPIKVHKDRHGNQIEGLQRLKDGRWRAYGKERFTFTEPDEDLAIARFRKWKEGKTNPELGTVESFDDPADAAKALAKRARASGDATLTISKKDGAHVVTDVTLTPHQWSWLRRQIVDRPVWVAQMVGIEQIGYLSDIPKPTISPSLDEVGQLYIDKPKLTPNWKAKAKIFWREFTDCVQVETLREITQEKVVDYFDMVIEAGGSPTYIRQRFGTIKTIINYPTKRGKWALDAKRALAFCGVLVSPKKSATDPRPIPQEDFRALLAKADTQTRAILLLALNCCMYGSEVGSLCWSDLDLEKGTLSSTRSKTGIVRIATLWPETIAALRKLSRRGDAIFLTEAGTQADYLCVYRLFKIVRRAAGLEQLQFAMIRDGAYTAAVEAGTDLNVCRLLAGHATGISDHYVKRRPRMVAAACDAVRNFYAPFLGLSDSRAA
jgi:integrase